jgi:hypothetical protein
MRIRTVKTERGLKPTKAFVMKKEINEFMSHYDRQDVTATMICKAALVLGENTVHKILTYDDKCTVNGGTAKAIRNAIRSYVAIEMIIGSGFNLELHNGQLVLNEKIEEQYHVVIKQFYANMCKWLTLTNFANTDRDKRRAIPTIKHAPVTVLQEPTNDNKMKATIKELIKHIPREKLEEIILSGFSIA